METLEAIFTRRSVRRFKKDKLISPDIIKQLLKAGMAAPSARNEQPWHFIVVNERSLLDKICDIHPYADMCLQAPLAIIPCIDPQAGSDDHYVIQDLSAASQNILLAARALGLGSVWLGVYPNKKVMANVQQLFNIPKTILPFNIMPIGYTDMQQTAQSRFQKDRVHENQW